MDILRDFVVFALLLLYIVVKNSFTYTHIWNSKGKFILPILMKLKRDSKLQSKHKLCQYQVTYTYNSGTDFQILTFKVKIYIHIYFF